MVLKQVKLSNFCASYSTRKVSQNETDRLITDFITHGLHPLSTVEEDKFIFYSIFFYIGSMLLFSTSINSTSY